VRLIGVGVSGLENPPQQICSHRQIIISPLIGGRPDSPDLIP